MPDSETYIHPIIQAMIASADSKDRALALAQRQKEQSDEQDFRRKQLAEVVQRAQDENRINQGHLDLARQTHDLAVKQFIHQAKHGVLEDIASGVQSPDTLPSAPTIPTALNSQPGDPSQTVTPSPASVQPAPNFSQIPPSGPSSSQDGNVDVGGESMPRAAVAQIPGNVARQKGLVESAVATAKDSAATPNQDKRDADNYKRAMDLADKQQSRAESVARINASASHDRGELALLARIMAVNGGMAVDPDVATAKYNAVLDGQTGYTSLSKAEKSAVDKIAAMRGTSLPTNQASYSKKLDQSVNIQKLLDQYRDLATNYSSDSPNQPDAGLLDKTVKGAQQIPLVGRFINPSSIPGTDIQSKVADLKSQAGQLAGYFDQNNRKSDQEIQRSFNGVFDPRSTMKQNLEKLNKHLELVRSATKNNFGGINPQDVENVLSNRGAHDLLPSMNQSGTKPLTSAIAHQLLVEAHGDNTAALKLATDRGYDVSKIIQ